MVAETGLAIKHGIFTTRARSDGGKPCAIYLVRLSWEDTASRLGWKLYERAMKGRDCVHGIGCFCPFAYGRTEGDGGEMINAERTTT